jgi:hypothetical protein
MRSSGRAGERNEHEWIGLEQPLSNWPTTNLSVAQREGFKRHSLRVIAHKCFIQLKECAKGFLAEDASQFYQRVLVMFL